jgi:hypothetical protein
MFPRAIIPVDGPLRPPRFLTSQTDIPMNGTSQASTLHTRLLGLFMLLCSAAFSYISIYMTLEKAAQHAATVSFNTKAVVIIPVTAVLGLAFLLFPKIRPMLWNDDKRLTVLGWITVALFVVVGLAFQYYFEQQLRALGYQF